MRSLWLMWGIAWYIYVGGWIVLRERGAGMGMWMWMGVRD
jgi:hypothetical protein